jgi:hypothetical protein
MSSADTAPTSFASPEDAYWAFFEADSAKDAEAWAGVMSYPHVRVSARGTASYYETPEAYASGASWESREATGWVRSRGIEPTRLHESADKVHLAAGWTRYNAADEPILSNRVTYILTRLDGSWGIQARFGVDSFTEGENTDESAAAAVDVVQQHLRALDARDFESCARLGSYPVTQVGVGEVQQFENEAAYERSLAATPRGRVSQRDVRAAQSGVNGVNVSLTEALDSGRAVQAIFLVAKSKGLWRIAGRSIIVG